MNIRDWNAPAVVYRMYDASGDLLYVGVTTNLPQRLRNHRSRPSSPWFPRDVAELQSEPFPTMREAAVEELRQIRELGPRYNRLQNPHFDRSVA